MFKSDFKRTIGAGLLGAGLLLAGVCSQADAAVLKFGHIANDDNTWNLAALEFARIVKEKTNGALTVNVYPNSTLGTERETIEGIPLGMADLTITADSLAGWAPSIALQSHMYTFRDESHVLAFMKSPIADRIRDEVREKAGLRAISYFLRGPRYLTSKRPIRSAADLKGFKLRVPNVPMFIKDWEACGASPVPMAFSEVFSALQQGVIDGQENPLALIVDQKLYEVQKYLNLTGHVRQAIFVVIGEKRFQSLPEDQRKVVLDAAEQMQTFERKLFNEQESKLEAFLKSKGMEFVATDVGSLQDRVKDVVKRDFPQFQADLEGIAKLH